MITRRTVLRSLGGAAAGLVSARPSRAAPAPPALGGVEFVTPDSEKNGPLFNAYNAALARTPRLRALCRTAEGVANAVRWARDTDTEFAVRSTGHCFAGHSQHEGLVIDTSPLARIALDAATGLVTIGAGAPCGDIYVALAGAGRGLAGGTFASVGIAGLTLGGGIGHMSRLGGLACDQLEALALVDAEGEIRTLSAQSDPELFWACRGGGGGSLGVVTELTFRTLELGRLCDISIPVRLSRAEATRVVHDWQHWSQALPRETTTHLLLTPYVGGDFLLSFTGLSLEPKAAVARRFGALLGAAGPVRDQWIVEASTKQIMDLRYGTPHYVSPLRFLSRSDIVLRPIPHEAVADLMDALGGFPANALQLNFESLGGAVADVAPDATAFPHRRAECVIHYTKTYRQATDAGIARRALDAATAALRPHVTGGVYVNYPEPDRADWARAYWGGNLERLEAVKRRVDPHDLFRHAQSIPV